MDIFYNNTVTIKDLKRAVFNWVPKVFACSLILHYYSLVEETYTTYSSKKIQPKTKCDMLAYISPCFTLAACIYFEFLLFHYIFLAIIVIFPEWLHSFWFYNTQLKTTQLTNNVTGTLWWQMNKNFSRQRKYISTTRKSKSHYFWQSGALTIDNILFWFCMHHRKYTMSRPLSEKQNILLLIKLSVAIQIYSLVIKKY